MEFISKSLTDTNNFAKIIAPKLKEGDILLLIGDLGAGKTTFVKALCSSLGVQSTVTSPTFTILNEYYGKFIIHHFDMYRVESIDEAEGFGFSEILNSNEGLILIEWPEVVAKILPKDVITIHIERISDCERKFTVEGLE